MSIFPNTDMPGKISINIKQMWRVVF